MACGMAVFGKVVAGTAVCGIVGFWTVMMQKRRARVPCASHEGAAPASLKFEVAELVARLR